jgi:hypothetical protein
MGDIPRTYLFGWRRDPIARFNVKSRFETLLRWGVYSVLRARRLPQTTFYSLAQLGSKRDARLFVNLFPQCLQEEWILIGVKPWQYPEVLILSEWLVSTGHKFCRVLRLNRSDAVSTETQRYLACLVEQRCQVPRLEVLCRSVIFHALGINPVPKVDSLPLPTILKKFVQCEELFEREDSSDTYT